MCGRFTLAVDPAELQEAFPEFSFPDQHAPRFNIAPTQPVLAIPNDGKNRADFFAWGLIPAWAKDSALGARMINARAETLAEKPAFRGALKYKRCLIPTSGFYEWKTMEGQKTKTPHFIHLKSGKPFAFAGLWDEWNSPEGGSLRTCTIITTEPNALMESIHNRMPVILPADHFAAWLDPAPRKSDELTPLLRSYDPTLMEAYPVSTLVNSPANDRAECVVPVSK
jgi:putative SOS response-associated peptidase YedK